MNVIRIVSVYNFNMNFFKETSLMFYQTIRGADELPVEVWRWGQVVGRSTATWTVWAALGGTLQQRWQHLFSQPTGCSSTHYHPNTHPAPAYHCTGTPAGVNRSCGTRGWEQAESDWQCNWIQCHRFIDIKLVTKTYRKVQTGYTKIQRWCTYYCYSSNRISKSRNSYQSIQCNIAGLFNLFSICVIFFFTFDFVQG